MISQGECTKRSAKQVGVIAPSLCNAMAKKKASHGMVTKNRYCQQCYNNAVKHVFQINENEKENLVRTTKFKAFHH